MGRILLHLCLLILQGFTLCVSALDIEQYEIVKRDVPGSAAQWWTLVFSDTAIEIPLLTTDGVFYDKDDAFGYVDAAYGSVIGPDGLQVRWLKEAELIWVSWRAPPLGNGVYYDEVHIIVDVSRDAARELWRVDYPANGNQGAGERQHLDVRYAYDEQSGRVVETLERHDTANFDYPVPLAEKVEGVGPYRLNEHWTVRTEFSIGPAGMMNVRPELSLELGDVATPIDDIARFVILKLTPRYLQWNDVAATVDEITPTELARAVASLEASRHFDAETRTLSGSVSLPFVPGIVGRAREPWEEEYVFRD